MCNLNMPDLMERPLILPNAQHKQRTDHMAIEVNSEQQSSYLTFTLALLPAIHHGRASTSTIPDIADLFQTRLPSKLAYGGLL
jgi:hypothetical protein